MTATLRQTRNPVRRIVFHPAPPAEHNANAQTAPANQQEQWIRLRIALVQVLEPFPETRAAIIRAFEPFLPPACPAPGPPQPPRTAPQPIDKS